MIPALAFKGLYGANKQTFTKGLQRLYLGLAAYVILIVLE